MKVLAVILIVFSFKQVFPQGEFIERGKNAYNVSVSLGGFEKYTGVGLNAGCSFDGTIDLGFSYSVFINMDSKSYEGTSATAISPNIALHIIKPSRRFPFSISVYALYQKQSFTNNSNDLVANVHTWSIGGALNHLISVSPTFRIQPGLLFAFSDILNSDYKNTGSGVYTAGLSVANILLIGDNRFVFVPAVAFGNGETTFSFAIHFVGVINNNEE